MPNFAAITDTYGNLPDWAQELLPIAILLAVISVIILRLPKIELGHSDAFIRRRFLNWFPLGMTYAFLYMGRYNITANAVAPSARTGMTSAVPEMAERMAKPEDGSFDHFAPENVSNLLTWLASAESAHVTGRVFESEGGRICICDGWRTTAGVDRGAAWAPAEIGEAMEKLLSSETPAQKVWGT